MARLWTAGFESQHFVSEGLGAYTLSNSGAATYDTSVVAAAGTRASLEFDSGATPGTAYATLSQTTVNARTYYFRFYVRRSSTTGQSDVPIFRASIAGPTAQLEVRLNSSGQLVLYNVNSSAAIGSPSYTLAATTWYCIEIGITNSGVAGTSVATLRINGDTIATSSAQTFSTTVLSLFDFGWVTAPTLNQQLWFDDCCLNDSQTGGDQNTWAGPGHVWALLPTADSSRGTNWYNDNAGTNNMFDALNNTPPVGVAYATATQPATAQIYNATASTSSQPSDYTMQTYTAAGIGAIETIVLVRMRVVWSNGTTTTGRNMNAYIVSNPAESTPSNTLATGLAGAMSATSAASWISSGRTILYAPSVTRDTAPVARVSKEVNSTNALMVCFAGIYVETRPLTTSKNALTASAALQQLDIKKDTLTASASVGVVPTYSHDIVSVSADIQGRCAITGVSAALSPFSLSITSVSAALIDLGRSRSLTPVSAAIQATPGATVYATDTFTRGNQSGWGTASDGVTTYAAYETTTPTLTIASNEGHFVLGGTTQYTFVLAGSQTPTATDVTFRVKMSATTGNFGVCLRSNANATTAYRVRVNGTSLTCYKGAGTGGAGTAVGTAATITAPTNNTYYWMRAQMIGGVIKAKVWQDGNSEPDWQYNQTDGTPVASGQFGFYFYDGTTASNFDVDHLTVTDGGTGPTKYGISLWTPSAALQQIGIERTITGISVTLASAGGVTYQRDIVSVSTALLATLQKNVVSVSTALTQLGIQRPITTVSSAVQALGITRNVVSVSTALQALGIQKNVVSVSGAFQALGITRNVMSVSSAVQALGVQRPITSVSAAAQQLGIQRPLVSVSTSVAVTTSKPVTTVSVSVGQLTTSKSITSVSTSLLLTGQRDITSVSTALQALGVERPISGVSGAVQAVGIERGASTVSVTLLFTGAHTISSVSSAVQALGLERPITGVSSAIGMMGAEHAITSVSVALKAFGVERPLTNVSIAIQQIGIEHGITSVSTSLLSTGTRPITSVTSAMQAIGVERPITPVSAAIGLAGATRPIVSVSVALVATLTHPISGTSTALQALGVKRDLLGITTIVAVTGITRPVVSVSVTLQQQGITRPVASVSVALQQLGTYRSLGSVSVALQRLGIARTVSGVKTALQQLGIIRSLSNVSVALQMTVTRPLSPVSTSVTLRLPMPITNVSGAVQALGLMRTITGIRVAAGVYGIEKHITGVRTALLVTGKLYTTIIVSSPQGTLEVVSPQGMIEVVSPQGTLEVQEE